MMFVLFLLMLISSSFSKTSQCPLPENYYRDARRGWFFGEVCLPQKKEEKKQERTDRVQEKTVRIEELSKEERLYRKYASISPEKYMDEKFLSSINPLEFRYAYDVVVGQYLMSQDARWANAAVSMMDFARRRALAFSYEAYNITTQNDRLNPAAYYGRDSWSGPLMQMYREQYVDNYLKGKKDVLGIYFFTSAFSTCPYCKEQYEVFLKIARDYGFSSHVVSYDSCVDYSRVSCEVNPGLFEKFQVEVIPNMIMVFRKQDGSYSFARVGSGLITAGEVKNNIYRYVRYFETGRWEDWLEVGIPRLGGAR